VLYVSDAVIQIQQLDSDTLSEMRHVKKLDLRMNQLATVVDDAVNFNVLERLTHVDVRDNRISELDISAVCTLEYLNCERNAMASLRANGTALKNLFASCNCEYRIIINKLIIRKLQCPRTVYGALPVTALIGLVTLIFDLLTSK